ncbi:MAG: hypothetical protein ACOYOV_14930 [Bacteroidales bacterium]
MTVNDLKEILFNAEKELCEINQALKKNPQDTMSKELKQWIEDFEINDIKERISNLRDKILNDILDN